MPARASSHVSATVRGHGGQGTNWMTMLYIVEAIWTVRRPRRRRVTVQPSATQPHQSKCRNSTISERTYAVRIRQVPYLLAASYQISAASPI